MEHPPGAEVVDLLESEDEGDAAVHDTDVALAARLQEEEYRRASGGGTNGTHAPRRISPPSSLSTSNPLGLDLSRVEVLRGTDPTPVVLFRGVGGKLAALASSFANFDIAKEHRSNRKCGAAENTGTNGKNCDNTFHPLAETNNEFDDKCRRITPSDSAQWVQGVVQPCMAAAATAVAALGGIGGSGGSGGRGGGDAAARLLLEAAGLAPHVEAEVRVLQYDAPVRAPKKEGHQFHRHLDHGMFGWVVLASFHAECDFYVRLGPRPSPPQCECGLPCKLAKVTKDEESPNYGRFYFCCRGQYNACKAWQWAAPGDETPSSERVLRLGHGDVLIFDASRQSDVEHGVDAVYRNDANLQRNYRVSVQWRVRHEEVGLRIDYAWMAKNLADFDDADIHAAFSAVGSPPHSAGVGGLHRVAAVQALLDHALATPQRARVLNAHVRRVCEAHGNSNRFLARRLVGGGRNHIETSWHIDPDLREACFRDTVRVPATPGATGPLRGTVRLPPLADLGVKAL